jgi:CRP/FNR family transcriptional regulator, cyclic AMP receptor protein
MLSKNLSIRRMNQYVAPSDEPLYRPTFFDGAGAARTVEQAATIVGRKAMKSFLEDYRPKQAIFSQGDRADAVFYIQEGRVRLSVISKQGKEATIALLGPGDFLGEGCIASDQPVRLATATATTGCAVLKIEKTQMLRTLHGEHEFSDLFVSYIIERHNRSQADLVDQLFNSSEKRLARALLILARFGKEGRSEEVIPDVNQGTLAEMNGTTRSRVNFFMNEFRKLGFIEYNGGLQVHSSLLSVVLHE